MRINRKGNKVSNVRGMRGNKVRMRVIGKHTPLTSQNFRLREGGGGSEEVLRCEM